jgi:hypothetical protein
MQVVNKGKYAISSGGKVFEIGKIIEVADDIGKTLCETFADENANFYFIEVKNITNEIKQETSKLEKKRRGRPAKG